MDEERRVVKFPHFELLQLLAKIKFKISIKPTISSNASGLTLTAMVVHSPDRPAFIAEEVGPG